MGGVEDIGRVGCRKGRKKWSKYILRNFVSKETPRDTTTVASSCNLSILENMAGQSRVSSKIAIVFVNSSSRP